MPTTEFGKSGLALAMTGSAIIPQYLAIGSGSGANVATLGSLIAEVQASRKLWSSRIIATAKEVEFIHDLGASAMSGVNLREFGIGGDQTKGTNDLWHREGFDVVVFDGSNELQTQVKLQIF